MDVSINRSVLRDQNRTYVHRSNPCASFSLVLFRDYFHRHAPDCMPFAYSEPAVTKFCRFCDATHLDRAWTRQKIATCTIRRKKTATPLRDVTVYVPADQASLWLAVGKAACSAAVRGLLGGCQSAVRQLLGGFLNRGKA